MISRTSRPSPPRMPEPKMSEDPRVARHAGHQDQNPGRGVAAWPAAIGSGGSPWANWPARWDCSGRPSLHLFDSKLGLYDATFAQGNQQLWDPRQAVQEIAKAIVTFCRGRDTWTPCSSAPSLASILHPRPTPPPWRSWTGSAHLAAAEVVADEYVDVYSALVAGFPTNRWPPATSAAGGPLWLAAQRAKPARRCSAPRPVAPPPVGAPPVRRRTSGSAARRL